MKKLFQGLGLQRRGLCEWERGQESSLFVQWQRQHYSWVGSHSFSDKKFVFFRICPSAGPLLHYATRHILIKQRKINILKQRSIYYRLQNIYILEMGICFSCDCSSDDYSNYSSKHQTPVEQLYDMNSVRISRQPQSQGCLHCIVS